jgi:hypothetical protein
MKSAKTFGISLSQEPSAVIDAARVQAKKHDFDFQGDDKEGEFAGMGIKGLYTIDGKEMTITIAKKPMILPWGVIESSIKKFFA